MAAMRILQQASKGVTSGCRKIHASLQCVLQKCPVFRWFIGQHRNNGMKQMRVNRFGTKAEKINAAKKAGKRVIAVGTTSCRTLESASTEDGILKAQSGWTDIFIYPGYHFKMVDALITNFHLPKSTLVMLVSALAGREHILAAYKEAVEKKYRFFSFGDAMFIK